MDSPLKMIKRCPARAESGECGSAVFYDWGLVVLHTGGTTGLDGSEIERWKNYAAPSAIKICARCMTPYVLEGGDLVDISEELGPEDIRAILSRGQATLPHPKIKDP